LIKDGAGTVLLSGINTYGGTTTVSAGVLTVLRSAALGATNAGTTIAAGAAVNIGGNVSTAEPFTINGAGISNGGALRKINTDLATLSGPIALSGAARINCDLSALTISGSIDNGGNALTLGGAGPMTISGAISGSGSLIKDGSGTVTLTASSSFSGSTTVSAGKLLIGTTGSLTNALMVNSSAVFGGTGTAATVTVNAGGHVAPGASAGTLNLSGDLVLASGAVLDYDLGSIGASDKIDMQSSTLWLNGQQFADFHFTLLPGFGQGIYLLIDAGNVQGSLGANTSGMLGTQPAMIAVSGNDLLLIVPEPGGMVLAATGLVLVVTRRRRRIEANNRW
jgi:autotransporter-associated beta strand protein